MEHEKNADDEKDADAKGDDETPTDAKGEVPTDKCDDEKNDDAKGEVPTDAKRAKPITRHGGAFGTSLRGEQKDAWAEYQRRQRDDRAIRECAPFRRCGLCRNCERRADMRRAIEAQD